ncbi:MAG: class I SAM-dependent methyltransferase [Candidatus Nanohaloarchaea archaeon]|nr:class I SAM-dependent methyltransferase [Candidatus Nanohaloarchaea archaeon]
MTKKRLDLGCGDAKPDGYVGLDAVSTDDADIVHDLRDVPLPFDADRFEHVRAYNSLEHLPDDAFHRVLKEIARITEAGGTVEVTGPHYLSHNAPAADHYRAFSRVSFDVYTPGHEYPTPEPDLFTVEDIAYTWNDKAVRDPIIRFLRWWRGDYWLRKHVPNAVDEITFTLEVLPR